ncbi:MAG: YadA-like family protein [Hyphomonadaceae bacterium]|nr:YadA-like family protein [Hyphomonadaceae bacterium]
MCRTSLRLSALCLSLGASAFFPALADPCLDGAVPIDESETDSEAIEPNRSDCPGFAASATSTDLQPSGLIHIAINSVDTPASATGEHAVAIGAGTQSHARYAVALGPFARANSYQSVAIGKHALVSANGHSGIAIGSNSFVHGDSYHSEAIGSSSQVIGAHSSALGSATLVTETYAVAIGAYSIADQAFTVSFGRGDDPLTIPDETMRRRLVNLADGIDPSDAATIGQLSAVQSDADANAFAIAQNSTSLSLQSNDIDALERAVMAQTDYVVVNSAGPAASAPGPRAIAIGEGARATKNNAIAFGSGALSQFDNAIALGMGAQTSRSNQIMFGTPMMTYAMPGLVSPASRNTQSGPTQLVTVDASGHLAGDNGATVTNLQTGISQNRTQLQSLQTASDGHAANIAALQSGQADNAAGIQANTTRSFQNHGAIATLRTDVLVADQRSTQNAVAIEQAHTTLDEHAGQIRTNLQRASDNATEIDLLKAGVAGDATRFNAMEDTVGAHEAWMKSAESVMLKSEESIAANGERIADNRREITTIANGVSANQVRIARSESQISSNQNAISDLYAGVERIDLTLDAVTHSLARSQKQIRQNTDGIAIANALAGTTWLQSNERAAFSLNAGYFDGSSAVALAGAARLHRQWSANFALGTTPSHGDIGARAGLRFGW